MREYVFFLLISFFCGCFYKREINDKFELLGSLMEACLKMFKLYVAYTYY